MGIATKQTINFTEPTVVAGSLLPAGDYNVTHEMQGQTHIMIFKQIGGTAEAKATCTLVPLDAKATRSEQRFKENAKNQRVLVEMTFYWRQGHTRTRAVAAERSLKYERRPRAAVFV